MKYSGTDTSGEIYIGKDGKIVYTNPYVFNGFIPFKGLLTSATEIRIGVDYDESPSVLDKKIENINVFTKKLNRYTVKSLIENKEVKLMAIDDLDKLEVWYRLQDFKDGVFTSVIKDSSNKNRNGLFISTPELKKTNNNRNSNSYKLLRNNFKAMKSTDKAFNISTPNIGSLSEFTIMVKVLYENSFDTELTLITYNNLVVKIKRKTDGLQLEIF